MRNLPPIVGGAKRWIFPMADRSAALLYEILVSDRRLQWSADAAIVLRKDPSLCLWALTCAMRQERQPPQTVEELAAWLVAHATELLQWPDSSCPLAEPPPIRQERFRERVLESLATAELAARLATRDGTFAAAAYFTGLLHNAVKWFQAASMDEPPNVPEEFFEHAGGFLPLGSTSAKLAVELLANSQPPAEWGFEVAACRRHAADRYQAWAEGVEGLSSQLPKLAARLARLEDLENRFQLTLEQEKLEAMAELAAGAGHEINNPLAIIAGRAQLLLKDEPAPERRRELAVINAQVKRAHEMIADMRLFARPPRPEPESLNLVALVDRSIAEFAPLAAERATSIIRGPVAAPLVVEADPTQLTVVFHALVRNALEAIGQGGRIAVDLEGTDAMISVRVRDDGPGIDAEHRSHIFDPFFSARQAGRGLGMGLSKCWRIINNHGGRIDVESQSGQGAVFTVSLPRRQAPSPCHDAR